MGDFISSPQQRAAESLYSSARSGHPIGANLLDQKFNQALTSLRTGTSKRLGGMAGDIASRAASSGFTPGSSLEGVIDKANEGVVANEQTAEGQLSAEHISQIISMLMGQLQMGLQGLPSSSPAGDLLGGLSMLGNIAGGIYGITKGTPNMLSLNPTSRIGSKNLSEPSYNDWSK